MTRREFIPCLWQAQAALHLDLKDVAYFPPDLAVPPPEPGSPRPGHRVRVGSPELYYVLLLPTEWQTGGHYPVIVEYAGNGPAGLSPQIPGSTVESGLPDDTVLGYGISAGAEYIWASLPFIQPGGGGIAPIWWGDPQATSDYCRQAVAEICFKYGGDPQRLLLCGFSRGSIACNFIGLHDDAIAALWRGFFCHSHYDGVHRWPYAGSDRESALRRLQRLNGRRSSSATSPQVMNAGFFTCGDGRGQSMLARSRKHERIWNRARSSVSSRLGNFPIRTTRTSGFFGRSVSAIQCASGSGE
jgi:hypothetical protein